MFLKMRKELLYLIIIIMYGGKEKQLAINFNGNQLNDARNVLTISRKLGYNGRKADDT